MLAIHSLSTPASQRAYGAIKKNLLPISVGMITFLISVLIFGQMTRAEFEKNAANKRTEAINYGSMLRTQIDRELNSLLFISSGLSSYLTVYHKELQPEKVEAILADLYARSQHVRNLGVAVNYRITYVYPLEGNEKILGVDFRDLPLQWPQVKQAVETRKGVLAGPLALVQGGNGLIYRYPVFVDGAYWGILSTVINTETFLQAAFQEISDTDFEFAIRVGNKPASAAFYGEPALFNDPGAFIMVSQVPNGHWEWAIKSKEQGTPKQILMMAAMGGLISLLLGSLVFYFTLERTRLTVHAMYDSLTGLANRRLLHDRMHQAYEQARRFRRSMAVIYVDLDYFKSINDTYGHDFGDELLKVFANKLSGCIRHVDTLSRIGGDEFVILLEEIADPQDTRLIADNIMQTFGEPVPIFDMNIRIELSLGIAIYQPESGLALQALLKQADVALYEAKGSGRNTYRIFDTPEPQQASTL